jgi:hypothetical protein
VYTGLSGEPAEQRLLRANGRLQRIKCAPARRGAEHARVAHRTVYRTCPVHHRTARRAHSSELQWSEPNGLVTWLAHWTVSGGAPDCPVCHATAASTKRLVWWLGYKYPQPPHIQVIQVFHLTTTMRAIHPPPSRRLSDALSRRDTPEEGLVLALSGPRIDFIDRLRQAHTVDPTLAALQHNISSGARSRPWALTDGLVHYAGWLYIPPASPLLQEILVAVHEEGHEGVQRTLHRLRREFHFSHMKRVV